jgi:hypothetical protein
LRTIVLLGWRLFFAQSAVGDVLSAGNTFIDKLRPSHRNDLMRLNRLNVLACRRRRLYLAAFFFGRRKGSRVLFGAKLLIDQRYASEHRRVPDFRSVLRYGAITREGAHGGDI